MTKLPTIHIVWIGSPMPKRYQRNVNTFIRKGYNVKVWTEPMEGMMNEDIFNAMKSWAGKVDVMRLEILYKYGGIYTDADSVMIERLPIDCDLVCMTSASGFIGNETIYAKKGHPALLEALQGMRSNIDAIGKKPCNIWDIAGATYITPIFKKYKHTKLSKKFIGSRKDRPSRIVHSYDYSWRSDCAKSSKQSISKWLYLSLLNSTKEENTMIPKNLFTIWIGDESKCPHDLLQTWKDKHPDWNYQVFGNETLYGRIWYNQSLIDVYLKEKRYPGVADVMRYELLHEHGGFCYPADSKCLHNIDELFDSKNDAYCVYENEKVRPGLVSPLYACTKGNAFAQYLIDHLPTIPPKVNGVSRAPWQVTGNKFMRDSIASMNYSRLKIWESFRFNPIHHTGETYKGNEKVYGVQQWGATTEAGIGVKEYNWK